MPSVEQDLLEEIIGKELSSVEFVRDYVQLRFDGPTLTAYNEPRIIAREKVLLWDESGFCDQLRREISHAVTAVRVEVAEEIVVTFDDGTSIRISLRTEDDQGVEAVMFQTNDGRWWVL